MKRFLHFVLRQPVPALDLPLAGGANFSLDR